MSVRAAAVRHPLLTLLLTVCAAIAMAEIMLHWLPLPSYVTDLIWIQAADTASHRASFDEKLLYELLPNSRNVYTKAHRLERLVQINSWGLRDPERSRIKAPDVRRIIILGSSTTYGAEVGNDQTLSAQLERLLNQRATPGRRYEVWNAGVNAYSPTQIVTLGRRLIAQGAQPDGLLLQINLLGPRAFLWHCVDVTMYGRDPSLLTEHFFVPPWTMPWIAPLAARSRLTLLLVAHFNRMMPSVRRREALAATSLAHHRQMVAEFLAEVRGRIPLAALEMPCVAGSRNFSARRLATPADLPVWCVPATVDERDPHPTAETYGKWAGELAKLLASEGWLR